MENIRYSRVCLIVLVVIAMVLATLGPQLVAAAEKVPFGNDSDLNGTEKVRVIKEIPTDSSTDFYPHAACTANFGGVTAITVNTTFTGGDCTVSSAVSIASGVTLRLEGNVILRMATSSFSVSGTFELVNSTMTSSSGGAVWQISPSGSSTIVWDNATIRCFTYAIYSWNAGPRLEITRSSIVGLGTSGSWYGIYVSNPTGWIMHSTFSGIYYYPVMISSGGSFDIHNNVFSGSYYGAYLNQYSGQFYNNQASGATYYNYYMYSPSGTYTNNIGSGAMYGAYLYGGSATFEKWKLTGSSQYGIYAYDSSISFMNSTITGNSGGDVYSYTWGTSNKAIKLINCVFNTIASGSSAPVEVYWFTNISVKWLSNSSPVNGATVTLFDNKGVQFSAPVYMDATGRVDWLPVMEYSQKGSTKTSRVPWAVNVTKKIGDRIFRNATSMNISQGFNKVDFILDDVPPWLNLVSPQPNSMTNLTNMTISGWTEAWNDTLFPISLVIQHPDGVMEPRVNMNGWFTVEMPLIIEGDNAFVLTVSDWVPNTYSISFNMTRDTILPPLTVTSPEDGILTNKSSTTVSGATEFGANLTINGEIISLDPDGSFSKIYNLKESWNEYYIRTEDKAGNYREASRSVQRDSIAPEIHIMSPINNFKTGMSTVQIQGVTEPKVSVTVNNEAVPLAGSSFAANVKLVPGENVITAVVHDTAMNFAEDTIHVFYDDTPPELTLTGPQDGMKTSVESVTVTGTAKGASIVTVEGQTLTMTGETFSYTITTLKEGRNTISVTARDDVGNIVRASRIVYLDTKAPSIVVESPFENEIINTEEVQVIGKTDDKMASLWINGASVSVVNMEFKAFVSLVEGTNTIEIMVKDEVGNVNSLMINVVRDMEVSLTLRTPQAEAGKEVSVKTESEEYEISGRTDVDATVMIGYNKAIVDKNGGFSSKVSLRDGENRYSIKATDQYGNTEYIDVLITKTAKSDGGGGDGGSGSTGGIMEAKKPNYRNLGMIFMILILVIGLAAIAVDHRNRMKRWELEKAIREGRMKQAEAQAEAEQQVPAVEGPVPAPAPETVEAVPVADAAVAGMAVAGATSVPAVPTPPPGSQDPRYAEATDILNSIEMQIAAAEKEGDDMSIERKKLRLAKKFLEKGEVDNALFHAKKIIDGGE